MEEGEGVAVEVGEGFCVAGCCVSFCPRPVITIIPMRYTYIYRERERMREIGRRGREEYYTHTLLQTLTNPPHPLSNLPPSLPPPTNTRHPHSLPASSSHTKCPNRFFDPIVKCTTPSLMTYSYTIVLNSSGSLAKNMLCACACVRASSGSVCSGAMSRVRV